MQTPRPPAKIKLNIIWIGDGSKKASDAKAAPLTVLSAPAAPASAPAAPAPAAAPAAAPATTTAPALGVAGHDTQAAIELAARIDNKTHEILFWCLDEHVDHYAKLFHAYPNIQVNGVRKFLKQDFGNPVINNAAAIVLKFMDDLLKPERNTIRDRVTIKELVSLFLLLSLGDYILDSNVRATDKLSLPRFTDFHMPYLFSVKNAPTTPDVWMMFSPPTDNQVALVAFNNFHKRLLDAENNIFAKEAYSQAYYATMGGAVVRAVFEANPKYWRTIQSTDSYTAYVKPLGVRKYYFNTHKWEARSAFESDEALARTGFDNATVSQLGFFSAATRSLIYDYFADDKSTSTFVKRNPQEIFDYNDLGLVIEFGHTDRLAEQVAMNININQLWTTDKYRDLTPLHYAILEQQLGCAEILLKAGARVDLKVTSLSDNASFTALELIQLITEDDIRQKFMSLYQRYHPDVKANKSSSLP